MIDTAKFQFNKKDILFILIIFIVAIALRIVYFNFYKDTNIFPILQASDSQSYYFWAKDIVSGDIWGSKAFMKWPFYAYWVALIFKAFGTNLVFIYSLQFVLGGVNCILIFLIAKKLFDRNIGLLAGLFSACYGLFIFYEGLLVYTSISLFLNSILFLWILYLKGPPRAKKLFCIGIFLGICVITQGNILIFGVLAMAWVLGNSKLEFKKKFYNFTIFLAGMSIIIGCVTLRNYLVEKDPVLITGNLGINFYLGNNPEATGTFFCPADITMNQDDMFRDSKIIAESNLRRRLSTSEVSSYWFNRAQSFIRQEPGKFLKLLMNKFIYVFIPREIVHDIEFNFIAGKLRFLKLNFLLLKFILPFGLLGMLLGLKNFHKNVLLYIILFSLSVSIAIFFVTARYRVMMVPYLLIFASFGIFSIRNTLRQKRYFNFCALILAVILIFWLLDYASVYA
ncbi:MAG: glycosyltransferase family 39 protein, partial [Candidatus Omnitrophota bacterium]